MLLDQMLADTKIEITLDSLDSNIQEIYNHLQQFNRSTKSIYKKDIKRFKAPEWEEVEGVAEGLHKDLNDKIERQLKRNANNFF